MNQPRVPAGGPKGGQWTSPGAGYNFSEGHLEVDRNGENVLVAAASDAEVRNALERNGLSGGGRHEALQAAGVPEGATVRRFKLTDEDKLKIEVRTMDGDKQILHQVRILDMRAKTIRNIGQRINLHEQQQGLGTRLLLQQVEAGSKMGFKMIKTHAVGNGESLRTSSNPDMVANGFYTWARLGFLPGEHQSRERSAMLRQMSTTKGRENWKKNGEDFYGEFDLREGSVSRRILESYARVKGYLDE